MITRRIWCCPSIQIVNCTLVMPSAAMLWEVIFRSAGGSFFISSATE